jgi:hypothetical protein
MKPTKLFEGKLDPETEIEDEEEGDHDDVDEFQDESSEFSTASSSLRGLGGKILNASVFNNKVFDMD